MAITTTQETQILKIVVGLFNAAPGAAYLTDFANFISAGNTMLQLANNLAATTAFRGIMDGKVTAAEQVQQLMSNFGLTYNTGTVGSTTASDIAQTWFAAQIAAGRGFGAIVNDAVTALSDANWLAANAAFSGVAATLSNKAIVADYYSSTLGQSSTSLSALQAVVAGVTATTDVSTDAAKAAAITAGGGASGTTFTLTTGADTISGTSGNDTVNAVLSGTAANNTLGGLDIINGGAGTDTLTILDETGGQTVPATLQISGVETVNVRSAGAATINLTGAGISGVTTLNSTQSTAATLVAATTTDVNVSGATGAITIDGGKNIVVSDAAAANDIVIGATTVNAGTITVTDTKVGAADVKVDGGTNVALTLSGSTGGGKVITVGNGGASTDLPTGTVNVTSNHTGVAGTDVTLNAITVKGGSTISVTQTADTSKAATDTTGATLTQGDVTVLAGTATTSVTTTQAASTAEVVGVTAAAGTTESASVKFSALTAGQTIVMGGLTFTASAAMTANEAAAAFANLVNGTLPAAGDSQSGGAASKGTYTNIFTGWTSGAASGDTVVFTSTTANANVTDLANTGTGTVTITTTAGAGTIAEVQTIDLTGVTAGADGNFSVAGVTVAVLAADTTQQIADKVVAALNAVVAGTAIGDATATDAGGTSKIVTVTYTAAYGNVAQATVTNGTATLSGTGTAATTTAGGVATYKAGVLGVANGTVVIDDNATAASVTTVTVDGYGNVSTIGATNNMTKLATLNLANSGSTGTAGETDATMAVSVGASMASLNLGLNKVKGAVTLNGAGLKTLNVTTSVADSSFALTANAVETLTVAGDHKATFSADLIALKSVTVTGTAGLVLSGNEGDTLTSVNTSGTTGSVSASIDGTLATYTGGAGVDTVTLVTGTALTKAIDLGAGDDTLKLVALTTGSTATLSGGAGTDTLSMTTATADALDATAQTFYTGFERLTINDAAASATLDLANLGFTNYVTTTGSTGTLTLNNLASGGTVVITTAPTTGYTVGVKDAATGTADVLNLALNSAGNLAAGVVTASNVETINISSTDTEVATTPTKNVNTLTLTADKATAVTVTGGNDLTLTMTGSTKVTSIDGSAMTGKLSVVSLNTTSATTIKGGSGNDTLAAATGTTADVLLGGAGDDILTVNAGMDTLTGGTGNDLFVVATASTNVNSYATITDFVAGDLLKFAGADSFAAAKLTLGDTAVFQDYANTAIKNSGANDVSWFQYSGNTYVVENLSTSTSFVNGTDLIVKLTGLVDLTNASFSATYNTIAL